MLTVNAEQMLEYVHSLGETATEDQRTIGQLCEAVLEAREVAEYLQGEPGNMCIKVYADIIASWGGEKP